MKRIALFLFVTMLVSALTACGPAPAAPTATATDKPTVTATHTPSPTATYTPMPPLEGRLFFDMNGSGLPDEASFIYDTVRLADPRQPLQSDLDKSIDDYVSAQPDLNNGDIMTIEEPGLSNYTVCVQANCAQTDAEGNFSLPNPSGASSASIKITDSNAGTPPLEMRYINDWKGPVVIPAYEMDGVQVPEQHLNDTNIIPIENGTFIKLGADNNVGLMQGFRTYTLPTEAVMNVVCIKRSKPHSENGVSRTH